MKQVLMTSDRALLARVPRPAVDAGAILVQVHDSLISTGTELAGLKEVLAKADAGAAGRVMELSSKASTYLGKAINDPHKAAERLRQIAANRVRRVTESARRPKRRRKTKALNDLNWTAVGTGVAFDRKSGGGFAFTSDDTPAGYQVMSRRIAIDELEHDGDDALGAAVVVSIKGKADTPYTLGMLNHDQSAWIGQITLEPGPFDEELQFDAGESPAIFLVLANGGVGNGKAEFSEFSVRLSDPEEGFPASETHQIGWNVGYSAAGTVVAVGDGVSGFKVGDRVACGGAGQANHAEFISVKRNLCVHVPSNVPMHVAATTTVGAIAMQGVRRADVRLGEVVCVIGLGLIGQITVQMLKAAGCRVVGVDLDADRAERAREAGADAVFTDPLQAQSACLHMGGGFGADATVITAAARTDSIINDAMRCTRRRGRVVIVGDVGMNIERPEFYKKEIEVRMSTSYGPGRYDATYELEGRDYPYAYVRWTQNRNMSNYLDLIAQGKIDIEPLIDQVVAVEEAASAYDTLARSSKAPLAVILAYDPQPITELSSETIDSRDSTSVRIRGARRPRGDRARYALVGAGGFGVSMLVPQLDKRKDALQLAAICSRDPVRGGNFARQRGIEKLVTDYEAVLRDPDIDLVVIATRHNEHADQVERALMAGKHVFVEKPLAVDWAGLERVRRAYEKSEGLVLMCGFNRGFSPAAERIRERLEARNAPLMVSYRLNGGYIPGDSWIQDRQGAGRNIGEACHMYDFFASLAGAPVSAISAQGIGETGTAYFTNDNFAATIRYEDGSVGNLVYTASGPKTGLPKERVEVFCEGQAFVIDDYKTCTAYPSGEVIWEAEQADKGHCRELSLLADAIAGIGGAPMPVARVFETTAVSLHIEDLLQGRVVEAR